VQPPGVVSVIAIFRQQRQVGQPVECRLMRKTIAVALFALALVSTWLVYSKVTQARRETAYRAAIAQFQRDLPVGTAREDVRKYLGSRKMDYHVAGSQADTYEIKIGEDSGNLVCEPWNVYVALEFGAGDKLHDLHIKRVQTCL
jgi:hypothetical protein